MRRASRSACIRGSPASSRSSTRAASRSFSAPGYPNQSRSHFQGTDIWSTANPANSSGLGWVGRYLDSLPSPVDPLVGWNTTGSLPHVLQAATSAVPAIPSPAGYAFNSPNTGAEAPAERNAAVRMNSHVPINQPELAFVYGSAQAALATLDRVATVATYNGTVTYPANNGFAQALKAVAGAMVRSIGTKIFYVTTGGFDNHSGQNVNGGQRDLLQPDGDAERRALRVLHRPDQPGPPQRHARAHVLGVRPPHHRERQPRHRPRRRVRDDGHGRQGERRAVRDRAGRSIPIPPTRRSRTTRGDVPFETDFRSVYARVIDQWLGADSRALLGGDFRTPSLTFI